MAGVQIYTESPISPAKATAQSPRTPSPSTPATSSTPSTTGEQPRTSSRNAYAPPHPSTTLPTPTLPTALSSSTSPFTPSAPQPGALPTPFVPKSRTPSPRREIPPPPKVGEKVQPPSYYSPVPTPTYFAAPQPFPSHMNFAANTRDLRSNAFSPAPTPTTANGYAPNNGYAPTNGLLSPQSARLPFGQPGNNSNFNTPQQTPYDANGTAAEEMRRSLEHPPGYVQNPYAADMTPEQRFATQHSPHSPTLGWNTSGAAKSPGVLGTGITLPGGLSGLSSPVGNLGGILNGGGSGEEESVWGMFGGWVKGVGKKVGEVEGEIWRRVNGD